MASETSHSGGGRPRLPPAKMTPSLPILLPHQIYSRSSPNLLPPPPPISSSDVAPMKKEDGAPTSLMIRNIPNYFQRNQMLGYLDRHCAAENSAAGAGGVLSEYDFFYLPMDFKTGSNLGYAFVNFTTAVAASRFRRAFDDYAWQAGSSRKICRIAAATIQGKEALLANFNRSSFRRHCNDYLPAVFTPARGGRYGKLAEPSSSTSGRKSPRNKFQLT
ncbi:Protein MEI2-like 6 [Linum grandiflorum]